MTADEVSAPFLGFEHLGEGARYLRADLHVHSFGVSSDVRDPEMTVDGIVATALERRIDLLAITDHNAIGSVEALLERGREAGLAVLCGVEISATEGHLLVYFDSSAFERFSEWFGRLVFERDSASGDRWTLTPMHELIAGVAEAGGIAIAAHVGRASSGLVAKALVKSQDAVLASAGLLGVEIDSPEEFEWFSPADSGMGSSERKRQIQLRHQKLGLPSTARLAKVRFSDAHELDRIGRNRDGNERLTRFKMSEPTFEGLRTALLDADARVRLEDELPESYPRILGARFVGGFLDGQEIRFSSNLTCLIGGRGAGKSTALNTVRHACLSAGDKDCDAANRPQTLQMTYQDEFGAIHYLLRDLGGRTVELTPEGPVETTLLIDGYAQNRVTEITDNYGENPRPLLDFLDGFADLSQVEIEIRTLNADLRANAEAILPVRDADSRFTEGTRLLRETESKLGAIEKTKFRVAIEWKKKLNQERLLRVSLSDRLQEITTAIGALNSEISVETLAKALGISDLESLPSHEQIVGADAGGLVDALAQLSSALAGWKADGQGILAEREAPVRSLLAAWEDRDRAVEARYQQVVQDLRAQGIAPDLGAINRLLTQQTDANVDIAKAEADRTELGKLTAQRGATLEKLRQAQQRRFHTRRHALARITDLLNASVDEFRVKIDYEQGALFEDYEAWLRAALGNRFFRSERLVFFCRLAHPIDLAQWVRTENVAALLRLKDGAGASFFASPQEASAFVGQLRAADLDLLETVDISDRPTITLVTGLDAAPKPVPFENLSLGQKASVLLGALLFAEDSRPLIIDQPEDHLDSRFIFGTVVANLRHVKEKRQVIVATHNANIAILGDAEMIVPLQGWEGKGRIREPGSVDARATRSRACDILEGGTSAYTRRGEMYGLLNPAARRDASRSGAD